MCFSASASFIAGSGLIFGGIAIRRCRLIRNHERMFAAIPFVFGVHQITEGIVWLGVYGAIPETLQPLAIYFFSFLAFVFWPIYIPFAMSFLEQSSLARYIFVLKILGSAIGLYYFWCFTFYSRLSLEVACDINGCSSLAYVFRLPYFDSAINYIYFLVATLPFFLTANPKVRWVIGPVFMISIPLSIVISTPPELPSTWYFFAAVVSLLIFFTFENKKVSR